MTIPNTIPDPNPVAPTGKASRHASLPPGLRELHRTTLRFFLDHGTAPTAEWLTGQATESGLSAPTAVSALVDADLVQLEGGIVNVAYPFSGTPTPHRVRPGDFSPVYAMCAIDALGVLLMAGRDGVIISRDTHSGEPVRVERSDRRWRFEPSTTVVLAASSSETGPSSCCSCPHINFHTDPRQAEAYLQSHAHLHGEILDQPAALEMAARIFGSFLAD